MVTMDDHQNLGDFASHVIVIHLEVFMKGVTQMGCVLARKGSLDETALNVPLDMSPQKLAVYVSVMFMFLK